VRSGYLSQYFAAVAAKRLSAVEANPAASNQHEFNGVEQLKTLFGQAQEKQRFPARFIYLDDTDEEAVTADGYLTWYDARAKSADRTGRSEHRLYFPSTAVSQCATEGDLLVIGRQSNDDVLVIVAEGQSTIERQLLWLFGFDDIEHPGFSVRGELESGRDRIGYAARVILEQIGIETEEREESFLEDMFRRFDGRFPSTRVFSEYARRTLSDLRPEDDPDATLMAWLDREEILFRTLERELVAERLQKGFANDIDGFIAYSLSVQNRRKSRAGSALENHLEYLFTLNNIRFNRAPVTENKSKPDFLFPGITEYQDKNFAEARLTMLAAKSSCKDRWRQVLTEAERVRRKHLLTLEASISEAQTDEMKARDLQLILPAALHETYSVSQQHWLMKLATFIKLVTSRQTQ